MSTTSEDMKSIAKGGGFNAVSEGSKAILLLMIFMVLARSVTQEEFGAFNLGYIIALMLVIFGGLGIGRATSRLIGFYMGKGDIRRVDGVIRSSMAIWATSAVSLSILYFLMAAPLSIHVFNDSSLIPIFQVFSVYVGSSITVIQISTIFRGLRDVRPKILFVDVIPRGSALGLMLFLSYNGAPIVWMSAAFSFSFALSAILSVLYLLKFYHFKKKWVPMRKEVLSFSMPLLVQNVLIELFISRSSIFLIGAFKGTLAVAAFSSAQKIGVKLPIVLQGMFFIFLPVLSGYMATGNREGMRKAYAMVSKWVMMISLPGLMIVAFFPAQVLSLFYSESYGQYWPILLVLGAGYSVQIIVGPSQPTMIAMGRVRALMFYAMIGGALTLLLNILLIPPMGEMGAAIGTAVSMGIFHVMTLIYIHREMGIHPFGPGYLKVLMLGPLACSAEFALVMIFLQPSIIAMAVSGALFLATVPMIALYTGAVTRNERRLAISKLGRFGPLVDRVLPSPGKEPTPGKIKGSVGKKTQKGGKRR